MKAGYEYVILDDMVLNVAEYMTNHPGGKFVISHNIGRDISKFFYGGYVLENNIGFPDKLKFLSKIVGPEPFYHRNIPRMIVDSLAVAKLDRKAPTMIA